MNGPAGDRFHATDQRYKEYVQRIISNGLANGTITPDEAALITAFITEVESSGSVGASRVFKLYSILTRWRTYIGPYKTNTIQDIYLGINALKMAKKENGAGLTANTVADYIKFLKRFYFWMIENGYSTVDEKKLQKIHPPPAPQMTKTAEQLLTEAEVKAMIKTCRNSRDRAIITMLYEGGFRISEIGRLRWNQVKFNDWNAVINVDGKTGKGRYIPLVMSRSYLAQWKNDYPRDPTGDAYVFLTATEKKPLQYAGIAKQISLIAQRAHVEKHITPHLFRHSRITHLIQQGYQESIIKKMMWGSISTKMFATYAHLTDTDIDDEIASKNGIATEKPAKEKLLEPRQCPKCFTINGPTQNFCGSCGLPLTDTAADDQNQVMDDLSRLLASFTPTQLKALQQLSINAR